MTRRRTLAIWVLLFLDVSLICEAQTVAPPYHPEPALGEALARPAVVYVRDPNLPCFADYIPTPDEVAAKCVVSLATNEYEPLQLGLYVPSASATVLKNVTLEVRSDLPYKIGYLYYERRARPRVLDRGRLWEGRRPSLPLYVIPGSSIDEIRPGKSAAFWVTFGSHHGVRSGSHAASIKMVSDNVVLATRDVEIRVHPFALPRPRAAFGCYYRIDRIPVYFGRMHQQLYAEDQAAHGHNSAQIISFFSAFGMDEYQKDGTVPQPFWIERWRELFDEEDDARGVVDPAQFLEAQMRTFESAGVTHPDVAIFGVQDNPQEKRKEFTADTLRRLTVKHNWPEILLYMRDEPPAWTGRSFSREFVGHITQYKRLRQCRSVAAMGGSSVVAWGHLHDVWIVLGGFPTPEMVREAARQGAEVWTYLHDLRITNPLANRYYAGLYMWSLDLQGNMPYAYHHGEEGQPHPVYLSKERRPSREQLMGFILPSADGPIPGVGYEGRREGIDDYRYLQLLQTRIAAVNDNSPVGVAAERWLAELKQRILPSSLRGTLMSFVTLWDLDWLDPNPEVDPLDYQSIRSVAADFIAQLPPAAGEANSRSGERQFPPSGLEGAEFDGNSVAECVNALRFGSRETKRIAACALALRRTEELNSPHTERLVDVLAAAVEDPDLRVPALRALRAIGPTAVSVLPALRKQLRHRDSFIRSHVVMVLEALGPAAIEELANSVKDPFPGVALLAAECLGRKGAAGAPALPVLEKVARESSNPRVRGHVVAAIRAIRGED